MTQPGYPQYPPQAPPPPHAAPAQPPQQAAPPVAQPTYPQQTPPYWPTEQQTWPGQQQPAPAASAYPQQGAPPAAPPTYEVDDAAIHAAQQEAAAKAGGTGDGPEYFKFPPPQGSRDWASAPVPSEVSVNVWVCQPPPGQRLIHHKYTRHFFKYLEGGTLKSSSVDCSGIQCTFDQAVELAKQYPNLQSTVENWGKPAKPKWLFNVLMLDFPNLHYKPDGTMEPMLLDTGPQLAEAILALTETGRLGNTAKLVDPYIGRPAVLHKKKTGRETFDVEYTANFAPDPMPLPQHFWPALHKLWDLTKVRKVPTPQDHQQAIMRLGWPMPGAPQNQQLPAPMPPAPAPAYAAGPQPPHPSPYPQPGGPAYPPAAPPASPPYAAPGGVPQPSTQYPQYPQAPLPPAAPAYPAPPQAAPPPPSGYPAAPPPVPPAVAPPSPPVAPPLPMGPPQAAPPGPPPPMNPPPQTVPTAAQPGPYGPPPMGPPVAPGGDLPFEQGPGQQPAQALEINPATGMLPAKVRLEGGRERCFGRQGVNDMMCKSCPDWIKRQCIPQSQQEAPPPPTAELAALQAQLEGTVQ